VTHKHFFSTVRLCPKKAIENFTDGQTGSGTHVLGEWDHGFVEETPRESDGTPISMDTEKSFEENDNYLLFPPRLLGYATQEKVWGQFSVDNTKKPPGKMPKKFHENLQLDEKYKDLIEALVGSHESNQERAKELQVKDVVQNKGKGLVLLLHGRFQAPQFSNGSTNDRRSSWSWQDGEIMSICDTDKLLTCWISAYCRDYR